MDSGHALTDEFNSMELSTTLVAEFGETERANHVITALGSLYVDFAFGTELGVLLTIVKLLGPVAEHLVALLELVASDAVVPRRVTVEAPDELTLDALNLGGVRVAAAGGSLELA